MKYGEPARVLYLENSPLVSRKLLADLAGTAGVETARSHGEFEAFVRANHYELVVAESLPGWPALEAFQLLQRLDPGVPFLAVADPADEEMAIECVRQGAADYLLNDRLARLPFAVRRALEERVAPGIGWSGRGRLLASLSPPWRTRFWR